MREVVQRTGCGLLLDVNNLYVSPAPTTAATPGQPAPPCP
jgi:uncharacterized protein (UPF0276 family)